MSELAVDTSAAQQPLSDRAKKIARLAATLVLATASLAHADAVKLTVAPSN
jgi:hypothetical protein